MRNEGAFLVKFVRDSFYAINYTIMKFFTNPQNERLARDYSSLFHNE